jgi:hypothetical protein
MVYVTLGVWLSHLKERAGRCLPNVLHPLPLLSDPLTVFFLPWAWHLSTHGLDFQVPQTVQAWLGMERVSNTEDSESLGH